MALAPRGAIDGLTVYGWRMTFSCKAVVIAHLPSAVSTASISAVSLNGLNKQATAPAASEARLEGLVALRGDEDDRNTFPAACQLLLKIWAAQTWQSDIEDQAVRGINDVCGEERFCRRKRLNGEPDLLQQVRQ